MSPRKTLINLRVFFITFVLLKREKNEIMAKEDNLKKFTSEYQPEKNGRPVGSKNRSTIVKYWLQAIENTTNPMTGELEQLSYEDLITLAQIKKAKDQADTNAYKALMDSGYGSPIQQIESEVRTTNIINLGDGDETNI